MVKKIFKGIVSENDIYQQQGNFFDAHGRLTASGNMLKDFSIENTKADYIWGMQLKDLKNISLKK